MIICPRCQHSNFDGFAVCSRCGSSLGAAPAGGPAAAPGGGGIDEYQRQLAAKAAAGRRNLLILGAVGLVIVGSVGYWWLQQKKKGAAAQAVADAGGRFADRDKLEMGAFWNCVTSSEVDVGMFKAADQIQQRIESAYFTQQKTFSEHLSTECVPKIERARGAMGPLAGELPADMKEAFDRYMATLPRMQTGIEAYAEKIKGRGAVKDIDQTIQEVVGALNPEATPESVAAEKFLVCAVPDLAKKKDMQEVLQLLAETCKTDAVKFMTRVREQCGPLVAEIDKDAKPKPGKTFKANAKKFFDEDGRQSQAFEYCAKRSRKGKKVLDLEEFLTAAGDYIEARANVAGAAKEAIARITGHPLEKPAAKAEGADPEGDAPPPAAAPKAKP